MFPSTRERVVPGMVAPAAERLSSVYQTAAHDVVLPLVGEIAPPSRPHARSFRDRVHSPLGRFLTRFLVRWLVIAPLPQPIQQIALLWPASILVPLVPSKNSDSVDPIQVGASHVSAWPGECLYGSADPSRAVLFLFGTAHSMFGNVDPNGMNGVRTAALEQMTFIKKAPPVMVDLEGKTVEKQKVEYRALFPREQVETSELRIFKQNGVTVQAIEATLDDNSEGVIELPVGFPHPIDGSFLKAELLINKDLSPAERPSAIAKVLTPERFEVEIEGDDDGIFRDRPADESWYATATNEAMLARIDSDEEPTYAPPALGWRVVPNQGSSAGTTPPAEAPAEGVYFGTITTRKAGQTVQVELFDQQSGKVRGRSDSVNVVPGNAVFGDIRGGNQAPGALVRVPADGTTEVVVRLENVRDFFENVLPTGVSVHWWIEEDGGEPVGEEETTLVNGASTFRYKAGIEPGTVKLLASVAGQIFVLPIEQVPLTVRLWHQWPMIEIEVGSAVGPAADGTPVDWGTLRGEVRFQGQLTAGRGLALWSYDLRRNDYASISTAMVFATVGRERADLIHKLEEAPAGKRVSWDRDFVVMGAPSADPNDPLATPAKAVVEGGQAGEQVRLVLGSDRFPVTLPIAAYPMNTVADGTTPDLFGGAAATVAASVTVDQADPAYQPGTFRFAGDGGLTLQGLPALTDNFGLNGWLKFDTLAPGQKVIEKAGSYGVQLVEEAGQPYLEFYVLSGGERKRVLSPQAIAAATWYHFTAHVRAGRLYLGLGEGGDVVRIGDATGPIDASTSPVEVGSTLSGNLDEVGFYDLSRSPFLAFEDGSTEKTVTLDGDGRAEIPVQTVALNMTPSQELIASDYGRRLQQGAIRIFVAPTDEEMRQRAEAFMRGIWRQIWTECLEGLATGESAAWAGFACDLTAAFLPIPGVDQAQSVRDATFAGMAFAQGKRDRDTYLKATFAVAGLVPIVGDVAGGSFKIYKRAAAILRKTPAEAILAESAVKSISQALGRAGSHVPENGLLRVLDQGGDEALMLKSLWGTCNSPCAWGFKDKRTWRALEDLGGQYGHGRLVRAARRITSNHGLEVAERTIRALKRAKIPSTITLTDDALDGLAVFIKHAPGTNRLPEVWRELKAATYLGDVGQRRVLEELFVGLKTVDARIGALQSTGTAGPMGFANWIARGAGTSAVRNSTAGFKWHLDNVLRLGVENLHSIDHADDAIRALGYFGRVDNLVKTGTTSVFRLIETKVASSGRFVGKTQLAGNIKGAMRRARRGAAIDEQELVKELGDIVYRVRGPASAQAAYAKAFYDTVRKNLLKKHKHLADKIRVEYTVANGAF